MNWREWLTQRSMINAFHGISGRTVQPLSCRVYNVFAIMFPTGTAKEDWDDGGVAHETELILRHSWQSMKKEHWPENIFIALANPVDITTLSFPSWPRTAMTSPIRNSPETVLIVLDISIMEDAASGMNGDRAGWSFKTVSYTHLTLPTIYSV